MVIEFRTLPALRLQRTSLLQNIDGRAPPQDLVPQAGGPARVTTRIFENALFLPQS